MKMMKKIMAAAAVLVMCFAFTACGGGDDKGGAEEPKGDPNVIEMDNYKAEYTGYEIVKDSDDEDAIVISYTFSNNAEESQSFGWAFTNHVFQDGVELDYAVVWEKEGSYDSLDEDTSTEIQPGKSIEVKTTSKLKDLETPVEVEFETFTGNEKKTIKIDITK